MLSLKEYEGLRERACRIMADSEMPIDWWVLVTGIPKARIARWKKGRDFPSPFELRLMRKIVSNAGQAINLATGPCPSVTEIVALRLIESTTVEHIASVMDIQPITYLRWEKGLTEPRASHARFLKWKIWEVLSDSDLHQRWLPCLEEARRLVEQQLEKEHTHGTLERAG